MLKVNHLHQEESRLPLTAADFLLPPRDFVDRCVKAYEQDTIVTIAEREWLSALLAAGRSKLEIVDALHRRSTPLALSILAPTHLGSATDLGPLIVMEELLSFAPGDDAAFVVQLYAQALDREPTSVEHLEAKFDLISGRESRKSLLEKVTVQSRSAKLSQSMSASAQVNAPRVEAGAILPSLKTLSKDGLSEIVIMRNVPGLGLVQAPGVVLGPVEARDDILLTKEGWLATGPRFDLPAGDWILKLDLIQNDAAEILVDFVANAGIDVIGRWHIVGSAQFQVKVTIGPDDRFLECRLFKPPQVESLNWLKVRNISMSKL